MCTFLVGQENRQLELNRVNKCSSLGWRIDTEKAKLDSNYIVIRSKMRTQRISTQPSGRIETKEQIAWG